MADRAGMQSFAYALLRIVAGFMLACHGAQKLFGWWGGAGHQPPMWTQVWFGGIIELVCGTLVALGLFTRPAALLCSGTMAVAYFQFHWKGAMGSGLFPLANGGELAVMYCFVFLAILAHGPGMISFDRLRGKV